MKIGKFEIVRGVDNVCLYLACEGGKREVDHKTCAINLSSLLERQKEGGNEADSKFIAASEAALQLANAVLGTAGQDINYLP